MNESRIPNPESRQESAARRVLIVSTTTGYQTRSFGDAAARQGIDLSFATDRCHVLEDPWRDGAVPVRFHDEDASVEAILEAARATPFVGILALGDRPTVIAARAAQALGLPGHPATAARAAGHKLMSRTAWANAGLKVPWFRALSLDVDPAALSADIHYPCVVKPFALSASRGVIRADDPKGFEAAFRRVARLLRQREIKALRDPANDGILIEGFIPGREFALEGVMEQGELRVLAIFDKPDPLDGPFFEETIYVTPSRLDKKDECAVVDATTDAARVLGLHHGPIHAECRINPDGVFVLEVAARPIGGLCARVLRFTSTGAVSAHDDMTLEDLLLRHASGDDVSGLVRETPASGVMMVPVPQTGYFRGVEGLPEAQAVEGIAEIRITAKPDQLLHPWPEGSSYLGFIFARAADPAACEAALRRAHQHLRFQVETPLPVL